MPWDRVTPLEASSAPQSHQHSALCITCTSADLNNDEVIIKNDKATEVYWEWLLRQGGS